MRRAPDKDAANGGKHGTKVVGSASRKEPPWSDFCKALHPVSRAPAALGGKLLILGEISQRSATNRWQPDCSSNGGIWTVAQSPPDPPSGALQHLPNQFVSLFALANCRQIYKVECYQGLR
jgi:hypothetical protein